MKMQKQIRAGMQQGAFTLIELLVVVSIIALLVAIILPALGKAKMQASKVVCETRIKGLGTATATYLSEYENTFPINGLLLPKSGVPKLYTAAYMPVPNRFTTAEVLTSNSTAYRLEYGALWPIMGGQSPSVSATNATAPPDLPAPQAALAKAYLCPDDLLQRTNISTAPGNAALTLQPSAAGLVTVKFGPGAPGYWSYSVNSVLNSLGRFRDYFASTGMPWIDPIKMTEIQKPSDFLFFVEEDQASPFNDEVFDAPAFGGGDRLTNRHNNGGNIGYGDGHVEWVSEVTFDLGGGNPPGTPVATAMQSPWTSVFFPDAGNVPTGP